VLSFPFLLIMPPRARLQIQSTHILFIQVLVFGVTGGAAGKHW